MLPPSKNFGVRAFLLLFSGRKNFDNPTLKFVGRVGLLSTFRPSPSFLIFSSLFSTSIMTADFNWNRCSQILCTKSILYLSISLPILFKFNIFLELNFQFFLYVLNMIEQSQPLVQLKRCRKFEFLKLLEL
jgi:hypothetical protein